MKIKLTSGFLILLTMGLNIQTADNYQVILRMIEEKIREESPSLFVGNLGIFPTFLWHHYNVMPLSNFLQLKEDSQNIVSVLRASQRGETKDVGTNSKKLVSIIGSPQCFEAYFGKDNRIKFTIFGSIKDANIPNSKLHKALEYTGHCSSEGSTKSAIALLLALRFDKAHEANAAQLWYERSIKNGSTVVAAYYLANFLNRQLADRFPDLQVVNEVYLATGSTYEFLAKTKSHLGSIRALADLFEKKGKFLEAAQCYKKAVIEKGHKSSITDMVRCSNMLWDPWYGYDETAPAASLLRFIEDVYELAAYRFGDEEAVNKLADLMREYDYERDDDDCYYLEKEALAKQIALCPDKITSNTMLRLGLLQEESYNMAHRKCKREWNKIYDMFLPAAQAGNFAAMVKLYHLSLKGGDEEKKQYWSDKLDRLYGDIFGTSEINDALFYLDYLGIFGEDLLKDACSTLTISSASYKEAALNYAFKPTVDYFTVSGFSAAEDVTLDYKRKREKDEVCDEPTFKRMRHEESEAE